MSPTVLRPPAERPPPPGPGRPAGGSPQPPPVRAQPSDAWPRTDRFLPWLIALFLVVVLVTPFDSTELRVSLPVDPKLDRLLIGVIAIMWVAAMFAGGSAAPRWRRSAVNVGVVLFAAASVLSVLLNAPVLFDDGEVPLAARRLSVLASWVVLFLVVATSVRRTEIEALLKVLLAASAVTAAGTLFEYFTGRNLFFEWWSAIVPEALFELRPEPSGDDPFVAQPVTGPMQHALALAGALTVALGYAMVRVVGASTSRGRLVYGAIAALLLLGVFATSRKTGSFATIGMFLTLLALRPRQVGRLLPVIVVGLAAMLALRPQAVEKQLEQVSPQRVTQGASAEGRIEDYRHITPDVRERVLTGRGFGTYDARKYRIIDNQGLVLVLEVGLIGTGAYVLMLVLVPAVARRRPHRPDAAREWAVLGGAAAAAALGTSTLLFDSLAFPGPVYLFFFAAGLVVVAAGRVRGAAGDDPGEPGEDRVGPPPTEPGGGEHRPTREELQAARYRPLRNRGRTRRPGGRRSPLRPGDGRVTHVHRQVAYAAATWEVPLKPGHPAHRVPAPPAVHAAPPAPPAAATSSPAAAAARTAPAAAARPGRVRVRQVLAGAGVVAVVAAFVGRGDGPATDVPTLGSARPSAEPSVDPFADTATPRGRRASSARGDAQSRDARASRSRAGSPRGAGATGRAPGAAGGSASPAPADAPLPERRRPAPADGAAPAPGGTPNAAPAPAQPAPAPAQQRPGADDGRPAAASAPQAPSGGAGEQGCLPGDAEAVLRSAGGQPCGPDGEAPTPSQASRLHLELDQAVALGRVPAAEADPVLAVLADIAAGRPAA